MAEGNVKRRKLKPPVRNARLPVAVHVGEQHHRRHLVKQKVKVYQQFDGAMQGLRATARPMLVPEKKIFCRRPP